MENIGRYHVVRELGRGAMGVVYLAQHPTMANRLVAIKTFRAPEGDDNDWDHRARLLAEADRAGSLDHPNIVKIYNVEDRTEPPYIEMEYVDGATLDTVLHTSAPDLELSLSILRQAAEALDYAHSRGIIHRDIKPANLMLDSRNAVKITDFGIAKRAGTSTSTTSRFMGTPDYMSPEQLDGRQDIDGRADQFALGTLAYQLITGRKPFEADTVTAVSHMIANKNPIPPSQINRKLTRQVDAVIGKALAKERERRYATCTEFTDALEVALLAPPRRAVPVWAPIAAAVVLLAGLIGVGSKLGWFDNKQPLAVTPGGATLYPSQTQQFLASGSAVKWTLSPELGSISEDGVYKAPPNNKTEQTITLTASDGDTRATAEIKLLPSREAGPQPAAGLSVSPSRSVLMPGQSQQFRSSAPGVRWSVTPNIGTISSTGLYVAPAQNAIDQKVTIVASSAADPGARASADVDLLKLAPPPPPSTKVALRIYAKDKFIRPGGAADPGDAEFWVGDIVCHVVATGLARGAKLQLVWFKDGKEADITPFDPPAPVGVRIKYENKPEPGSYRVRLLVNGQPVPGDVSFTVQPSKS